MRALTVVPGKPDFADGPAAACKRRRMAARSWSSLAGVGQVRGAIRHHRTPAP
jgi:hypothetical protein